jgi:hypothetical protein
MARLTETNLINIKYEVTEGRLTFENVRRYLMAILFFSGVVVGVAYLAANEESTVGWDTLSPGIHYIFYLEAALFIFHLFLLLFCIKKNYFNQKLLMIGLVVLTYKAAIDPYLAVYMFYKDQGYEESELTFIPFLIVIGLIIHIISLTYFIKRARLIEDEDNEPPKKASITLGLPFLFILISSFSVFVRNGSLGNHELTFSVILFSVLFIAMLIGVCEFILAAYGVFHFPSFSVSTPKKSKRSKKKNAR